MTAATMTSACAVDDCDRAPYVRGWCTKHYQRWRTHGDPATNLLTPKPCTVDTCQVRARRRGMCHKHYQRWYRHGDTSAGEGRYGNGWPASDGYIMTAKTGHVLARAKGQVGMHRLVLFGQIGYGPHLCHWCGTYIHWAHHLRSDALVVDHRDGDKQHNTPTNLVPSCPGCNTRRGGAA